MNLKMLGTAIFMALDLGTFSTPTSPPNLLNVELVGTSAETPKFTGSNGVGADVFTENETYYIIPRNTSGGVFIPPRDWYLPSLVLNPSNNNGNMYSMGVLADSNNDIYAMSTALSIRVDYVYGTSSSMLSVTKTYAQWTALTTYFVNAPQPITFMRITPFLKANGQFVVDSPVGFKMWVQNSPMRSLNPISYITDDYELGYDNGVNDSKVVIDKLNNDITNLNTTLDTYRGLTYEQIIARGQNSVNTAESGIISLFGAIAEVPITILNGVMSPTVFGVPIVSVLLTFLALSVVLWLIRLFI